MRTPPLSIALFLLAAFLGALGQFLYKSGAARTTSSPFSYLNPRLIGGVLCYTAVMALFVAAFKRGGSLTVLYPLYATTFVWAAIIALTTDGTPIKPINILGMLLLAAGMGLMGR
jgi:hypothetical protein